MRSKLKLKLKKHRASVWLLKVITVLRLLFGFYTNVSDSKPICFLIKLYCICISFTTLFFFFQYDYSTISNFSHIFIIMQYIFIFIISYSYGDDYFTNYCSAMETNDRVMGIKTIPPITNYVYFFILIYTVSRFYVLFYRFNLRATPVIRFSCISFLSLATDLSGFMTTIIFSILHSRVKILKDSLNSNSVSVNIIGRNEINVSIKQIRKGLYHYANLLDTIEYTDKPLQSLLIIQWTLNSIHMTFLTYNTVKKYNDEQVMSTITAGALEIVQTLFLMSGPAIIAEAIGQEVNKIKRVLTYQVLRNSDESLKFELETALHYVTLRPFIYEICGDVHLNMNLIFTIISLCITYVIVIMQLTRFSV